MTAVADTPVADAPIANSPVADTPVAGESTGDEWTALLATATLEDATDRKRRATVEVPPAVLALVKQARDNRKRITLPYDATKFEELQNVLYSAGDLLEPKASVTVSRVKLDGEKATVVKDHTATHIRVFVGERRGQRQKAVKGDAKTAPAKKAETDVPAKSDV